MFQTSAFMFQSLLEDIVILIISYLEPPAVLILTQTCRRFHDLARLRIVWTNAYIHHVLAHGYIFPSTPPIPEMSTEHLRSCTLQAYRLSRRWLYTLCSNESSVGGLEYVPNRSANLHPRICAYIEQTEGMSVSEVRFLPCTALSAPFATQHLVVTLGKTVWSVLSVWSITNHGGRNHEHASSKKVAEWGPRGAIFTGFVVNDTLGSEATVAISFQLHERYFVKLLSISRRPGLDTNTETYEIIEVHTMRTSFVPKTLSGDLLVLADHDAWVEVWDWRAGTCAVLEHLDVQATIQTNECMQVLLSPESKSIIVARARSIHIFPWPNLTLDSSGESGNPDVSVDTNPNIYRPFTSQSFGWVDGLAINIHPNGNEGRKSQAAANPYQLPSFNILVRGESDDPWASDVHRLQVWTLAPNPDYHPSLTCGPTFCDVTHSTPSPPLNGAPTSYSDPSIIPPFSSTPDQSSLSTEVHNTVSEGLPPSMLLPPYTFPPTLTATIPCLHGALRCKQVALGRFGTAVWIKPPARQGWGNGNGGNFAAYTGGANLGLTVLTEDVSSAGGGTGIPLSSLGSPSMNDQMNDPNAGSEVLVGVSLNQRWDRESGFGTPSRWQDRSTELTPERSRGLMWATPIFTNDAATGWSAFDYDETGGRVVLVNSFGRVVVLEL